jgi:hypothetical protein
MFAESNITTYNMQVIFYVAKYGTWQDGIVAHWTRGPYSHCELLFSDGMAFSSSPRDGGTRFKQIEFKPHHWDLYPLSVDGEKEAAIRLWCEGQLGKKYDWLGIFGFVVKNSAIQDPKKWYCSEICANVLNLFKVTHFPSIEITPNKLAKKITV